MKYDLLIGQDIVSDTQKTMLFSFLDQDEMLSLLQICMNQNLEVLVMSNVEEGV